MPATHIRYSLSQELQAEGKIFKVHFTGGFLLLRVELQQEQVCSSRGTGAIHINTHRALAANVAAFVLIQVLIMSLSIYKYVTYTYSYIFICIYIYTYIWVLLSPSV